MPLTRLFLNWDRTKNSDTLGVSIEIEITLNSHCNTNEILNFLECCDCETSHYAPNHPTDGQAPQPRGPHQSTWPPNWDFGGPPIFCTPQNKYFLQILYSFLAAKYIFYVRNFL
jgi:hypothetical protein